MHNLKNDKKISKFARKFLLQGELLPNILVNGKIEATIFCYQYSQLSKSILFEEYADELLDSINHNIYDNNITFSSGISGVAWGCLYLAYMQFVDPDISDALDEIDITIMKNDPRRFTDNSFDTGFEGILYYVNTRLLYAHHNNEVRPFDDLYINDINTAIKNNINNNVTNKQQDIFLDIQNGNMVKPDFEPGLLNLSFSECF